MSTLSTDSRPVVAPPAASGLLVAAAASGLAFVAVYLVAVRTSAGQSLDTRLMLEVSAALSRSGWTEAWLDLWSPAVLLAATCTLAAYAVVARGGPAAAAAGATVVVTVVVAQVLKAVLHRPAWWDGELNSLPSGHVAAVAGLAAAAVLASPVVVRAAAVLIGVAAVVLTGVATLAQEWHRPSDVIASVLLAVTVGCCAAAPLGGPSRPA